jgi:hypothetical protein
VEWGVIASTDPSAAIAAANPRKPGGYLATTYGRTPFFFLLFLCCLCVLCVVYFVCVLFVCVLFVVYFVGIAVTALLFSLFLLIIMIGAIVHHWFGRSGSPVCFHDRALL